VEARAAERVSSADTVVGDFDEEATVVTTHAYGHVRRMGVFGDVRDCLGDEVVGGRFDRLR
jgi:hypothetical protein